MRDLEKQRAAMRAYYHRSKHRFKNYCLRINKEEDADIYNRLESIENKQGYIKSLIRKDIRQNVL